MENTIVFKQKEFWTLYVSKNLASTHTCVGCQGNVQEARTMLNMFNRISFFGRVSRQMVHSCGHLKKKKKCPS